MNDWNDCKVKISIADTAYEVGLIDFMFILDGAESMLLDLEINGHELGREETKRRRLLAHDMLVGLSKHI